MRPGTFAGDTKAHPLVERLRARVGAGDIERTALISPLARLPYLILQPSSSYPLAAHCFRNTQLCKIEHVRLWKWHHRIKRDCMPDNWPGSAQAIETQYLYQHLLLERLSLAAAIGAANCDWALLDECNRVDAIAKEANATDKGRLQKALRWPARLRKQILKLLWARAINQW